MVNSRTTVLGQIPQFQCRCLLITLFCLVASLGRAAYYVYVDNAQSYGVKSQYGPFASPEEAQAFINQNDPSFRPNMHVRGSPDASAPAANNNSGLSLQQQVAGAAAAQMAVNMNATPIGGAFGIGLAEGVVGGLFPSQPNPQEVAAQQAAQQAAQAAQQYNNTGIYYYNKKDYADAITEFSQALAETPNDTVIAQNLANARALLAKQQQDAATAARNSGALGQLLGNAPSANPVNNSPLSLVNLDSDPNVVKADAPSQSATPEAAVQQLDNLLGNTSDQAKKALSDFADKYLPGSSNASGAGAQEQAAKTQQETKAELDQTLGENPDANTDSGGTAGIKGLPGIALNDSTGNGGSKPYGIPGLPGTYVNGPGEGSGLKEPNSAAGTTADAQASQTATEPLTTETAAAPREQAKVETTQPETSSAPDTQPETSGEATPVVANNDAPAPAQYNQQAVQMGVSPEKAGLTPVVDETPNSGTDTKAGDQLVSMVNNQNPGNNFDSGGNYAGSLNTASSGESSGDASVNLSGKQGVVNPGTLKGNLSDPGFSAPGQPIVSAPDNSPSPLLYRQAAGYKGPLSTLVKPPPHWLGLSDAKRARFQSQLDALYASDGAYTTNRSPLGWQILERFAATDAVLYGKMDANGEPTQLILAFRGTVDGKDWFYGNLANGTPSLAKLALSGPVTQSAGEIVLLLAQKNSAGKSDLYGGALIISRLVVKEFPGVPLILTGHSLGGGEAALVSAATGLPAITFNAAGVRPSDYGLSPSADTSQITNYYVKGEPLTSMQNALKNNLGQNLLPTALGTQVPMDPVTDWTHLDGNGVKDYVSNVGNHGIGAVEPAFLNYINQQ